MINRVLLLALLSGCGAPTRPLTFGLHRHASGSPLVATGVSFSEQVFTTTPGRDQRQVVLPSKPHCEVTAPSGAPTACSMTDWTEPSLDEDNGVSVLRYTLTEPGWHEVKVTLDEGGALAWRAFAAERKGEVIAQLAHRCGWVERLRGGGWLCDDVFLREGEAPQALGAERTSASGDFVWAFNAGEVRRFRDSGSGPLTPEPRFDTGLFIATQLFATQTDAVLQHPGGFALLEVSASGTLELTATLARVFTAGAVVRRLGAVLLVGEPAGTETDVCVFSISAASLTPGACRRYSGALIGEGDGGGLALLSGPTLRVVNASLDEGIAGELPEMVVPTQPAPSRRGLAVLPYQLVPRVAGGVLRLESYEYAGSASEELVWSAGSVTTVMRR